MAPRLNPARSCWRAKAIYSAAASLRSEIAALAALSSIGKKSSGPGLLAFEVIAALTTKPVSPAAADIAFSCCARSLGLAKKK